jgi:peptide-methionine (S)-S-oxide reductase
MRSLSDRSRRAALAAVAGLAAVFAATFMPVPSLAAEEGRAIPPPAVDVPSTPDAKTATAVFAGGCFWGVQGVFQHTNGVLNAVSGYAGGEKSTAKYGRVSSGTTGHAESVQVTFDPNKISYGKLLQIFFSVVHDPTQLNRQGPDTGTQYRSAIFPMNAAQADVAKAYIAQLNQARVFDRAIVTRIEPDKTFYRAEDYHQDYLTLNPRQPYIAINDLPKLDALKTSFPDLYRARPVLVTAKSDTMWPGRIERLGQ